MMSKIFPSNISFAGAVLEVELLAVFLDYWCAKLSLLQLFRMDAHPSTMHENHKILHHSEHEQPHTQHNRLTP
jgi:hypothetical protein